jgi:hypothetical protein
MRTELIRLVADRIDLSLDFVTGKLANPPAPAPARPMAAEPAFADLASPGTASLVAERAFFAMCLAAGELGRDYLGRLRAAHLSSDVARRAAQHLLAHFDDPLDGLPDDQPALAALVTGAAMDATEQEGAAEPVLRMSFLQLELRRVERELRRAGQDGDLPRQDELAGARQEVRRELDSVMGQTA